MLIAKKNVEKHTSFFILEHIWSCDGGRKALQQLQKSPELTARLAELFNVSPEPEVEALFDVTRQAEVLATLSSCSKTQALDTVNECDGDTISAAMKLDAASPVASNETKQDDEIKCTFDEFKSALRASGNYVGNESYLKKMYENFIKGDGCGTTLFYNWSDDINEGVVTVYVLIPSTARKNSIKSLLTRTHWTLVVDGKELINGDLHGGVKVDESFWSIESAGLFCMTMEKITSAELWPVSFYLLCT